MNDDVGAFAEVPRKMIEGATSAVRSVLTGLLAENSGAGPTMRDKNPLFDAAHGNLAGTGGQLNISTLSTAIAAMRRQTGSAGEVLAIRPRFIEVPPELENNARSLISDLSPAQVTNVNPWSDLLEVVVEPGLSDTGHWYVAGDPATADGLAHAFLDGFETPTVDREQGFQKLGLSFRCRLHFGASFIDWRNRYANNGVSRLTETPAALLRCSGLPSRRVAYLEAWGFWLYVPTAPCPPTVSPSRAAGFSWGVTAAEGVCAGGGPAPARRAICGPAARPRRPHFSAMNSTPAASRAARVALTLEALASAPASIRFTVRRESPDALAICA